VELAGIPGSGKSRRARKLAERLAERGVTVVQPQARVAPSVPTGRRLARKALACAVAGATAPGTTLRVVRGVVRSRQPGPADVASRVVQWLVAEDVTARAARHAAVSIVDEGPVQALWSIGLRGDVTPVLAALGASPRPRSADLLVVVRVPPELALARLTARRSRHSRTQLLDEPERLGELERGARLLDRLVDWWSDEWGPRRAALALDGAADDGADHEQLLDRICASVSAGGRLQT
jgi:hypothetical protein